MISGLIEGRTGVDTLRELRKSKGWSIREFAERAGVSADTVLQAEHGTRKPGTGTLEKFANALGVDVADLLMEPVEEYRKAGLAEMGNLSLEEVLMIFQSRSKAYHDLKARVQELPPGAERVRLRREMNAAHARLLDVIGELLMRPEIRTGTPEEQDARFRLALLGIAANEEGMSR
jgi:transcriptional regulator with XRE-family HTH domain